MNHKPLNLGLGIDSADGFLKTGQPIDTKNNTSLNPRFFRSFSIPSQNFLVSLAPTVMLKISLYPSVVTPRTT